jgi:hypothetical protein
MSRLQRQPGVAQWRGTAREAKTKTSITVYLTKGGLLEHAQQMAAHESARTTKLYDRRNDKITLDEVERIAL